MQELVQDIFNTDDFAQLAQYVPAANSSTSLNFQASTATYVLMDRSAVTLLAQSWTQASASTVRQVQLRLQRVGTLSAGSYLMVTLCKLTAGVPDPTLILAHSNTVDCSSVGTSVGWVTFTLVDEFALDASTTYAVVLSGTFTPSGSNGIRWLGNTAGGTGGFSFNGSAWTSNVAKFMVYASIPVIYDAPFSPSVIDDVVVENTAPSVTCRTADVADANNGATLVLNGTTYNVIKTKPDGSGLTVLDLSTD